MTDILKLFADNELIRGTANMVAAFTALYFLVRAIFFLSRFAKKAMNDGLKPALNEWSRNLQYTSESCSNNTNIFISHLAKRSVLAILGFTLLFVSYSSRGLGVWFWTTSSFIGIFVLFFNLIYIVTLARRVEEILSEGTKVD